MTTEGIGRGGLCESVHVSSISTMHRTQLSPYQLDLGLARIFDLEGIRHVEVRRRVLQQEEGLVRSFGRTLVSLQCGQADLERLAGAQLDGRGERFRGDEPFCSKSVIEEEERR